MKSVQPLNPSDTDFMGKLFEKYFSLDEKSRAVRQSGQHGNGGFGGGSFHSGYQ